MRAAQTWEGSTGISYCAPFGFEGTRVITDLARHFQLVHHSDLRDLFHQAKQPRETPRLTPKLVTEYSCRPERPLVGPSITRLSFVGDLAQRLPVVACRFAMGAGLDLPRCAACSGRTLKPAVSAALREGWPCNGRWRRGRRRL